MELLLVCLAALGAAALTFFSGFGLGTLLMPVVALFFPVDVAIAITAVVHFANNLFKLALVGRNALGSVLLRFGLPAILFALLGALLLNWLSEIPPLISYTLGGRSFSISPVKLTIGLLILLFLVVELSPRLAKMAISPTYLPLGGMISGFFGGLSGHQGAFRSMFLIRAGLDKTQFIATGVTIAVMVDLTRLLVYGNTLLGRDLGGQWPLILSASLAAFIGSFLGNRLLTKLTYRSVQLVVSGLLLVVAVGLISGLI
ncbi:MAG: TSUP family transporter [Gammaproteobacteria bacterium]|nr:TSUP family transporter [Pseudomonadales bacterium]MCP5346783.1 TSUP family transporter [Pseudomonadales bacterium]